MFNFWIWRTDSGIGENSERFMCKHLTDLYWPGRNRGSTSRPASPLCRSPQFVRATSCRVPHGASMSELGRYCRKRVLRGSDLNPSRNQIPEGPQSRNPIPATWDRQARDSIRQHAILTSDGVFRQYRSRPVVPVWFDARQLNPGKLPKLLQ
jgi:hypothetical protein